MHRFFAIFMYFVVALTVQLCGGVHVEDLYSTVDLLPVQTVDAENNDFGQNCMNRADCSYSQEGLVSQAPSVPQSSIARVKTAPTNQERSSRTQWKSLKTFFLSFVQPNRICKCNEVHFVSLRQVRSCEYYIFTLRRILI